jgi:hypothetical protein
MENTNQPTSPATAPKSNKTAIIVVIAVVVLLIVGGNMVKGYFGRKMSEKIGERLGEKILEKGTGGKVDIDNGSVTFTGKEGKMEVGTSAKWPEDMPTDVPNFSAGEITAAVRINNPSTNGWSVIIKDVEAGSVGDYTKQLETAGWKTVSQVNFGAAMYQLEKGDYKLNIAYDETSKGINLMVENTKKTN